MVCPAPAIRSAISRISASVVAELLPRSTSADASRRTSSGAVCMMLVSRAMANAASSDVRLVATPKSTIVRVNSTMSSVATPSCPAAAATAAISSCDWGSSRANARRSSSNAASCGSVTSLSVFATPAHADSHRIAARADTASPAVIAADMPKRNRPVRCIAASTRACRASSWARARSSARADFSASDMPRRNPLASAVIRWCRSLTATGHLLVGTNAMNTPLPCLDSSMFAR